MGFEKRMQCGQTDAAQDGRGADGAWNWMGLGKVARWSGTSWLLYGRISCQGSTSLGLRGRGTRGKFLACLRLRRRFRSCLPAARSSRRCWAWALRVTQLVHERLMTWRCKKRQESAQTNRLPRTRGLRCQACSNRVPAPMVTKALHPQWRRRLC